jgi:hypothetical protein
MSGEAQAMPKAYDKPTERPRLIPILPPRPGGLTAFDGSSQVQVPASTRPFVGYGLRSNSNSLITPKPLL